MDITQRLKAEIERLRAALTDIYKRSAVNPRGGVIAEIAADALNQDRS